MTRSVYGDRQEDDGVRTIHVYLTIMTYLYSSCLVQGPVRLRSTGGGHSVWEFSVCTLSGTSITVMSPDCYNCDIHHDTECVRREPIVLSVRQGNIILDLDVTPFIVSDRRWVLTLWPTDWQWHVWMWSEKESKWNWRQGHCRGFSRKDCMGTPRHWKPSLPQRYGETYFVYYESRKRELKTRPIYECRWVERLKTKAEKYTRLAFTGLLGRRSGFFLQQYKKGRRKVFFSFFPSPSVAISCSRTGGACWWCFCCCLTLHRRWTPCRAHLFWVEECFWRRALFASWEFPHAV